MLAHRKSRINIFGIPNSTFSKKVHISLLNIRFFLSYVCTHARTPHILYISYIIQIHTRNERFACPGLMWDKKWIGNILVFCWINAKSLLCMHTNRQWHWQKSRKYKWIWQNCSPHKVCDLIWMFWWCFWVHRAIYGNWYVWWCRNSIRIWKSIPIQKSFYSVTDGYYCEYTFNCVSMKYWWIPNEKLIFRWKDFVLFSSRVELATFVQIDGLSTNDNNQ